MKINLRKFFYVNFFIASFVWLPFFQYTIWLQLKNVLFIVLAGLVLINTKMKIHHFSIVKILFIYSLLMTIPLLNTIFLNGFNLSLIIYAYAPFLLIIILSKFQNFEKLFSFSLLIYISAICIHSLYIIYTRFFGGNVAPTALVGGWAKIPIATMGFTNSSTAMSPLIGLAILIVLLNEKIKYKSKILLIPILFYALLLTGGEGGLLSLVATFAMALLIYLRINKYVVTVGIFIFLYFVIQYADMLLHFDRKILMSYEEHLASWYAGIMMFIDHYIVGVGFFNSPNYFEMYIPNLNIETAITAKTLQPHNPMILILAEAGLFGGLAFLLLLIYVIMLIRKNIVKRNILLPTYILMYYLFVSIFEPWPFISNFYFNYLAYMSILALEYNLKGKNHG